MYAPPTVIAVGISVITSITPVPAVLRPIKLPVAIEVDISGVKPPVEVIGATAVTAVTNVVLLMSAATTWPQDGFPAALPCNNVVVVPWLAKSADAKVALVMVVTRPLALAVILVPVPATTTLANVKIGR